MIKLFEFKKVLPQIPNLLLGRFRFKFEMLPFEVSHIPLKKRWNFLIAGLNQFILPSRPLGKPVIAQVEPSNICNLDCPLCLTASQNNSRPPALLSFEAFKKLIDDVGDYLLLIVMWNWGEPFLNPNIFDMIRYATHKKILVHCSTNGNVVFTDKMAEKIVDSGLTSLIFGVDGATQDTYRNYRKGGDLERVKENIRTLLRARQRKASNTPMLTLRFVAMKHNESELPAAEQLARELGVDFFSIKSVDTPAEVAQNLDPIYSPNTEKYRRYEYETQSFKRIQKPFVCMRPWKRITMDALGEIISCEYDYKNSHSFGQIPPPTPPMRNPIQPASISTPNTGNNPETPDSPNHASSYLEIWKSAISAEFRGHFNKGHNDYYHCKVCSYKDLQAETCILEAYPVNDVFKSASQGSGISR